LKNKDFLKNKLNPVAIRHGDCAQALHQARQRTGLNKTQGKWKPDVGD